MKTIIFATNNQHKVDEINSIIHHDFIKVISLKEADIHIDIPEPFDTLEENSLTKAKTIFDLKKQPCFAEDTGLFVEALNGEPGVKSARYAGDDASSQNNIAKLLDALNGLKNRKAYFKTIITYIDASTTQQFEGVCEGIILDEASGNGGFGYDPIFEPLNSSITFAEMTMEEKNKFSHRKKAVEKFVTFLLGQ